MKSSRKDRGTSIGSSVGDEGEGGTSKVNVEGASTFSAVMNLLNTCIGVGILAVPGCFASSGIVPTLLVILLNAFFCFASVRLLLKAALSPRGSTSLTLDDLGFRLFGNVGMVFIRVVNLGMIIIACLAFLNAVKAFMQDIALFIDSSTGASLPDYIIGEEQISVPLLLFFYVCIFPLLFLRKISMLKYSGFVVVALTVFMTICVIIYAGAGADYVESNGCTLKLDPLNGSAPVVGIVPRTSDIVLADIDFSFLNTLSLISTSYILQLSVFPIFSEMLVLRDGVPTACTKTAERKMAAAAAWTTLLASSLYITVGLAGYFTWFNLLNNPLNTNMLYCYDLNEPGWGAVFLVISIGMIFVSSGAFPVVFFALRGGLIRVIMPCFPAAKQAQKTSGHRERRRSSAPSLPELPDKIDGNGSNGIAAHGQQSKSVYELNREVEEEGAAAKYASIENKAWLAVTIGISTITVVLSSLPQVNLKLVLSWGCALFGYPLAFTMPGLFFIRACWHGFQAEGEEGHSGAALSRVQTAARLEMGAMQTRRAGMGNNGNNGTAEKGGEEKGTDSQPSKEKSTRRRASAAPDNIDEDMLSNVEGVTHVEEEETVSSGRGGSYSEKREGRERGKSSAFNLGTLHGSARKRSQYRINNAANNAGDSSADNSDNGINSGSGSNGIGSGIKQIEIAVRDKKGHSSASSSRHSLDFHMLRAVAVAIVGFGVIAQALAIYYLVDDIISP